LVTLDETSPDVLHEVERSLESRVVARARLLERRAAGLSAVNNILAAADPTTKQLLRQHVADHDAALSRSLSQTPLLFSDLVLLDDKALWNLFGAAEQEWVLLAMAGASPALAERVMNLLPASEAKDFRRALADLGPTRLSDVEEAQHRIAELACRMELEGDLHMPPCRLGAMAA
jgi:flagellar motor switch protein FliG